MTRVQRSVNNASDTRQVRGAAPAPALKTNEFKRQRVISEVVLLFSFNTVLRAVHTRPCIDLYEVKIGVWVHFGLFWAKRPEMQNTSQFI